LDATEMLNKIVKKAKQDKENLSLKVITIHYSAQPQSMSHVETVSCQMNSDGL
jgi:hypothetical protein